MLARALVSMAAVAALGVGPGVGGAAAATPIRLYLSQAAAFSILGHSCGGIQEEVYVRGFAANGYPAGNVNMHTSCGGSGRGGGGHTTTYTGTASVIWTWFGETRSFGPLKGPLVALPATDSHGDRVYNVGTAAYLEDVNPPLRPPAPPTGVSASVALAESGETEFLQMTVSWTVAPATAGLLRYSTMTATPVKSSAPVLSAQRIPYFSFGYLQPAQPSTTYRVTVTSTDAEGTSKPSTPIEITTPGFD